MKVSIIIRTKNEERWIELCLKGVYAQSFKDFEVIIVDNNSSDSTVAKAKNYPVDNVLYCDNYLPGKALNIGISEASGDFIVCLSGHCIPTSDFWLDNLLANMEDEMVAGVYGRQEPLSFTSPADKRDLLIVFGPEKRVQHKDSFFHNANSMVRRSVLRKFPFDESVTNIEDRIWAKQVLSKGYKIIYEPEASVYHWHGIHQDGDIERCSNVVKILEGLSTNNHSSNALSPDKYNIAAIIPIKGSLDYLNGISLLNYTIKSAKKAKYLNHIIVATDDDNVKKEALKLGADKAYIRDALLSEEFIGLEKIYNYVLGLMVEENIYPDLLVLLETTFPFKEPQFINKMIEKCIMEGLDTVIPVKMEYDAVWVEDEAGSLKRIDEGLIPRKFKKPIYRSIKGLCIVTRPEFIRNEEIIGQKVGFIKIDNPYSALELRSEQDYKSYAELLKDLS